MDNQLIILGIIINALVIIDLYLGVLSFKKKDTKGVFLGISFVYIALVALNYMAAIMSNHPFVSRLFFFSYFLSIDIALYFFLLFTQLYIGIKKSKRLVVLNTLPVVYFVIEVVVFTLSLFNHLDGLVIDFVYNETLKVYKFQPHLFYTLHLLFSYILIVSNLTCIVVKTIKLPRLYRPFYINSIIAILSGVVLNVIYLFASNASFLNGFFYKYDTSLAFYTLTAGIVYWNCYDYSKNGYVNHLKKHIFAAVGQYIIIFDDENINLYVNDNALNVFSDFTFEKSDVKSFLTYCNVDFSNSQLNSNQVFTIFKDSDIFRGSYNPIFDKKNRLEASIITFEKTNINKDILTGLDMIDNVANVLKGHVKDNNTPIAIGVCDLNGLHDINTNYSSKTGDKAILKLVDTLKAVFPKEAFFFRGTEATIIAILVERNKEDIHNYMKEVQSKIAKISELGCFLSIQFSTTVTNSKIDIDQKIKTVVKTMRSKKLLDGNSLHSETMTSLLKTLEECDSDTEAHVKRTQKYGSNLGKVIGLSDNQLSDLSLLCVLHDIGKIAVPLDILNKPGKLTDDEWKVIKSHVVKGYQIVNSSLNISHIATMVLHHHEKWDGTGYPSGLKGEEIPILSRIISVVDAYDAMVSDRPYRKGRPHEEAIAELIRCAGSQFDPNIVEAFVKLIQESEKIEISNKSIVVKKQNTITNSDYINENLFTVKYSRYTLDENEVIIDIDENFEKITGYNKKDIETNRITQTDLMFKEDVAPYVMAVTNQLAKKSEAYIEHRIKTKDGFTRYVLCLGRRRYDSASRREVSDITITNLSDSHLFQISVKETANKGKEVIESWNSKYHLDSITGLLTFDAFKDEIDKSLADINRHFVLTIVDIDNFKEYDERYGFQRGDEVLAEIGNGLASLLGKQELASRVTGDKFVLLLSFDQKDSEADIYSRLSLISEKLDMILSSIEGGSSISLISRSITLRDNFTSIFGTTDLEFRRLKRLSKEKRIKKYLG